jgi:hypothetical protein
MIQMSHMLCDAVPCKQSNSNITDQERYISCMDYLYKYAPFPTYEIQHFKSYIQKKTEIVFKYFHLTNIRYFKVMFYYFTKFI